MRESQEISLPQLAVTYNHAKSAKWIRLIRHVFETGHCNGSVTTFCTKCLIFLHYLQHEFDYNE